MPSEPISLEVLLKYAAGELSSDEAAAVERLTATSEGARKALSQVRSLRALMLADDSEAAPAGAVAKAKAVYQPKARPGIVDQIKRFIGELVFDSRSEAAMAGLRGGDEGFQLSYHSPVAELDIECLPSGEGEWRIRGHITPSGGLPESVELSGPTVSTAAPDHHGGFVMTVTPGEYELRLVHAGAEVVFPPLTLE